MNISIKSLIWLFAILFHNTYGSFSPPQKDTIENPTSNWININNQKDEKKKYVNHAIPKWVCTECNALNSVGESCCLKCNKRRKKEVFAKKREFLEEKDIKNMSKEQRKIYKRRCSILKILEQVEKGKKIINQYDDLTSKVLIIGVTGSGKSTLINGLSNKNLICKEMIVKSDLDESEEFGEFDEFAFDEAKMVIDVEGSTNIKIGHNSMLSETTIPNFISFGGINYIDSPGFGDSRGNEEEIINSFFINSLFKGEIKLILLIPKGMLNPKKHEKKIGDLIKKLRSILGDLTQYKDSIAIVATKVSENKKNLQGKLVRLIRGYNKVKTKKEDQLNKEETLMFLRMICKEDKMNIFPAPDKAGTIDKKHIENIREMLGRCKFKKVKKANISVSSEAKSYVSELNICLNQDIFDTIEAICTSIENEIKNNDYTVPYLEYLYSLAEKMDKLIATSNGERKDSQTNQDDEKDDYDDYKEEEENETEGSSMSGNSPLKIFKHKMKTILEDDIAFFSPKKLQDQLEEYCANFFHKAKLLDFLYKIDPEQEKNIKTHEWKSKFVKTKEEIEKDAISPIRAKFKKSLDKYLEEAEILLQTIYNRKKEIADEAYIRKDFTKYKDFVDDLAFLADSLEQKNSESILEVLLKNINTFINRHGLEEENRLNKHENKIISYSSILAKEGGVFSFEEKLIEKINSKAAHIQKDFQNDKEKFLVAQKNSFIKAFKKLNKDLEIKHKAIEDNNNRFIEEEEHKEMDEKEKVIDKLKISIGVVEAYGQFVNQVKNANITPKNIIENIEKKMEECGLKSSIKPVLQEEHYLEKIYTIDPSMRKYKENTSIYDNINAEIRHEIKGQIQETHKNLERTYENLKEKVKIAFQRETDSSIKFFTQKVLEYVDSDANQSKKIEEQLKGLLVQNGKGKIPLDKFVNILIDRFEKIVNCKALEEILESIKTLKYHPKREKILREAPCIKELKKLKEGLKNCKGRLVNMKLSNLIKTIQKTLQQKIVYEMGNFRSLKYLNKVLDNLYYEFRDLKKFFNIKNVQEFSVTLGKVICKVDHENLDMIKSATEGALNELSHSSNKEVDVDADVQKDDLITLQAYIIEERSWYKAWEEKIYRKVFSREYIYKKLKDTTIDEQEFKNFLKLCGISENAFKATGDRKNELERTLKALVPSYEVHEKGNKKVTLYGINVKLSEVLEEYTTENIIQIIGLNSVFIDTSIPKERRLLGISIISPKWYIEGNQSIDLSGFDGTSYYSNYSTGGDGKPGKSGTSAGNFFGIIQNYQDYQKLTIQANGGNGGRGQDGGDGYNGSNGSNGSDIIVSSTWVLVTLGTMFRIDSHNADWCDGVCGSWYSVYRDLKNFGSSGSKGGDGGKAGKGGLGGRAGIVKVYEKNNKIISQDIKTSSGKEGKDGKPGKGGKGGKNGNTRHYKVSSYVQSRLWDENGYASDGITPSDEKNGTPEIPESYEKNYNIMVQSSRDAFNDITSVFEEKYKDYPLCKLLIYEQTEDFNVHYVQESEETDMINID